MSFIAVATIGGAAIAGLVGAGLESSAATGAAQTQAQASNYAAQEEAQTAANQLGFQQQVYGTETAQEAPFLAAGTGAVNQLSTALNTPVAPNTTGALTAAGPTQQWATPFNAPTAAQAAATPGEQFALQQGEQAIQNSAAAQGNLLSGSTLKGMEGYGENLASTYYQQAYNNALQQYQQNYNVFSNNQSNWYNRLAALAGTGQTATGQLNAAGGTAAATSANTALGSESAITQAQQNAAAAMASGYVGSANALAGGIQGIGTSASQLGMLNSLGLLNTGSIPNAGTSLASTAGSGTLSGAYSPYAGVASNPSLNYQETYVPEPYGG